MLKYQFDIIIMSSSVAKSRKLGGCHDVMTIRHLSQTST